MKKATVIIAESGKHFDLEIPPGTTAQDILNQVNLGNGYVLSSGRGQEPFGSDEVIYDQIADGCKLYASTPVEVGSGPLSSFIDNCIDLFIHWFILPEPVNPQNKTRIYTGSNVVRRAETPYWEQRGWKKILGKYHGYYRTKYGSFRGEADVSSSGRIELFIFSPPDCLRKHSHWPCFMKRPNGKFFIHNNKNGIFDLSSGIMDVERIITESFGL
ncbi:MAG: hypothetical protein PHH77_04380 [Victivallaceae bacterium]|nr:hypothetical protein [Victivallaceae bacterium]